MGTDATRQKLHIPNWYSPYLEKHHIYDLFHELVRELVIQKPDDHVLFVKTLLYHASASRNAPRIILLGPPQVNSLEVAKHLAQKCKATIVTEDDIMAYVDHPRKRRPKVSTMTRMLSEAIRAENVYYTGWILTDYPKYRKEATHMQREGILPTHVFHFIPPFAPSLYDLNFPKKDPANWTNYRRAILGMRDAFKSHLKEIYILEKDVSEVVDECMELIQIKRRYKCPIIPRICILGPRGSGRKTQAKQIAEKFNLVYINFEYLLYQTWISETHLSSLVRGCKEKIGFNSVILTAVIHKRILEKDCLERGWVMIGFPHTVENLKHLDMLDTPPNRIFILECDLNICKERISRRRINKYSGSITNLLESQLKEVFPYLETHPKDKEETITAELSFYCENYEVIRKYCGKTASIVEANQPIQWITETLAALVMRPLPDAEPRCPFENLYEGSDISDDVDDIPDKSVTKI